MEVGQKNGKTNFERGGKNTSKRKRGTEKMKGYKEQDKEGVGGSGGRTRRVKKNGETRNVEIARRE